MEKCNEKNKVILIGGEGFIGRNIVEALMFDFKCYSVGVEKSLWKKRKDKFIATNPYANPISEKYDVYIHLIDNKAEHGFFLNEEKRLMKNLSIGEGKQLIVFSSAAVYANPGSPYAKRKVLLENFYEEYCIKNGIKLTILRLFNIYGQFQMPYRQGSLVANIFFNYLSGKPIEINDMAAKRDFIYAKDMAKIVQWVIVNEFFGKYDLATGKLISINELLKVLENNVFSHKIDVIDKKIEENNICPLGSSELYRKIESTSLKNGLVETLSFFQKNTKTIKQCLGE